MNLQSVSESQANPEVPINENFEALDHQSVYAKNPATTTGLTWGYLGGRWGGIAITAGTVTLIGEGSPTPTNYVVVNRSTGVVSVSTVITNWNNVAEYARVYKITTTASAVLAIEDHRAGVYGVHGMPGPMVWRQATDNDTLVLADAENAVEMNAATAKAFTVPPNSSVAFPVGTKILLARAGAGAVTVLEGSGVTIRNRLAGSPQTHTLSGQYSVVTLVKRDTNTWYLYGDLV